MDADHADGPGLRLRKGGNSVMMTVTRRFATLLLIGFATQGCSRLSEEVVDNWDWEHPDGIDQVKQTADCWYAAEADSPVGARQRRHVGKLWPPFPRPTGKQQQLSHRYHAAHYWPHPYVCQDRAFVKDVMNRQVANGWTNGTTLYRYHFDADTQELTHSGRLHLRWILENVAPNRRVAWVQSGANPEISQKRLENVRAAAEDMVGQNGDVPPIMARVATPLGRPADEIVEIRNTEMQTMPKPRVPYRALPSSGAGTGG